MFNIIKYEDIDKNVLNKSYLLIDVRSPGEHKLEPIPNSINIPIFNDEERKLIGTIYKQESIEKAKKIGIEIASKKLPGIYEEVTQLNKQYDNLIFFCARGGFRSSSLVSLFKSIGINVFKLDGGYKGYRNYINEILPDTIKKVNFIVLYGNTGTGKTSILKSLENQGMDVLDLEGYANHRGSVLGGVGLGDQNSQKKFESLIYECVRNRKTNTVFVEGESKKIGKIIIPDYLYDGISHGINIKIEADLETRVDNILKDYVHETDDELISSLNFLRRHIGNKNIDKYIQLIKQKNYKYAIEELMVKYYDPLYQHNNRSYSEIFYNKNNMTTSLSIIDWVNKNTLLLKK